MAIQVRNHQLVAYPAFLVRQLGIALTPNSKTAKIARHELLKRMLRFVNGTRMRADGQLPHMRNVEEAGMRSGVEMLLHHAKIVLDGHRIAGEFDHFCAAPDVEVIERRPLQRL